MGHPSVGQGYNEGSNRTDLLRLAVAVSDARSVRCEELGCGWT